MIWKTLSAIIAGMLILMLAAGEVRSQDRPKSHPQMRNYPVFQPEKVVDPGHSVIIARHVVGIRSGYSWDQRVPGAAFANEFSDDPEVSLRFLLVEDRLQGQLVPGDQFLFVSPPVQLTQARAPLIPIPNSRSILVLEPLSAEVVAEIKSDLPHWIDAETIPDEMWTLAEKRFQWMSYMPLSETQNGVEVSTVEKSIAARQIDFEADIGLTEEALVGYIKDLIALRHAVLHDAEWRGKVAPESEEDAELDVFQRQVLQMALRKKAESAD